MSDDDDDDDNDDITLDSTDLCWGRKSCSQGQDSLSCSY